MLDAPVVDDVLAPLLLGAAHAPRAPGVFAIAAPCGLSRLRAGSSRKTAHRCNRFLRARVSLSHQKPRIKNRIRPGKFAGTFHASMFRHLPPERRRERGLHRFSASAGRAKAAPMKTGEKRELRTPERVSRRREPGRDHGG